MAKRIPITIDAEVLEVNASSNLASLVPAGTKSVVTRAGQIIPASSFNQYRAADVPEGFDTQAATINKAWNQPGLLQQEAALINDWLGTFEYCSAGPRHAFVGSQNEFIAVKNFPLPDGYAPDYIHLAVYLDEYPRVGPIGIYLASRGAGGAAIAQVRTKLNVFRSNAFHGAEQPRDGFEWVCLVPEGWPINRSNLRKGQNLQKYLAYFYGILAE